jgi:hypothetical protein
MQPEFCWFWVQEQVAQSIGLWNRSASPSGTNGMRFTLQEQKQREQANDEGEQAVERELRRTPSNRAQRREMRDRIIATFARFSGAALGLEPEAVKLLTDDFLPAGARFARLAREFDAKLSMADTIQACRSAWTACGLQLLLGAPMGITPSILGYSLLYPYSDNYLDCTEVSAAVKLRFSERFRARLRGQRLAALDDREAALWALVGLIEGEFQRTRFPQVFDCLLAIHRAQEESIAQLDCAGHCADAEMLRITCAKGGTSVLADACLAHGRLEEVESRFAFQWGVLLQLGDDLQDVREDLQRGSATVFTRAVTKSIPLDALVMQLLNFSDNVAAGMNKLQGGSQTLKDLLKMSWRSLIIGAVAELQELFTPAFLEQAELSSPFRFEFLHRRHTRLTSRRGLFATLFNVMLEGEDSEPMMPVAQALASREVEALPAEVLVAAG